MGKNSELDFFYNFCCLFFLLPKCVVVGGEQMNGFFLDRSNQVVLPVVHSEVYKHTAYKQESNQSLKSKQTSEATHAN